MRIVVALILCSFLLALPGCEGRTSPLKIVLPVEPLDASIVQELSELLNSESALRNELLVTPMAEKDALNAVASGQADIALVSNILPFRNDIASLMPLYPTVLHIVRRDTDAELPGSGVLRGDTVYAGPPGSASRQVFSRLAERLELDEVTVIDVASADDRPDIVIIFAPISPQIVEIQDGPDRLDGYHLYGIGTPEEIGNGGQIDAATLLNPHFRPFVIPVGTYKNLSDVAVATVAVDKMLVTRPGLDSTTAYSLIDEILRLRPALAADRPGLFQDLSGDFEIERSTYILHSGAQDYLNRSAPSVYERYSGIAEVVVTLVVALGSASIAIMRILQRRRKNRIDEFYKKAIAYQRQLSGLNDPDEIAGLVAEIRSLQNEAFDLLVEEKLAADDSFRIFITLSNDVLQQFEIDND